MFHMQTDVFHHSVSDFSIVQTVDRRRYVATILDKPRGLADVRNWHDCATAEQAAELDAVAGLLAGHGYESHRRRFLVDHADCHLVRYHSAQRLRRRVTWHGNHV